VRRLVLATAAGLLALVLLAPPAAADERSGTDAPNGGPAAPMPAPL